MSGISPHRAGRRDRAPSRWRRSRRSEASQWPPAGLDQEQEVRDRLYAKPPPTERTVVVLGPVERLAERPAA